MRGERRHRTVTVGSVTRTSIAVCVVLSVLLAGCTSTNPTDNAATSSGVPPIPPAAFLDHTGVTPTSVTIANISTLVGGLFEGALVGTRAYADFVNAHGGIDGRRLVVQSYDDQFTGALNKQAAQAALDRSFALVGDTQPGGQFRRHGPRSQSRVPERVGVARPDDSEAREHLQRRADGPGMAARPAPLLQGQVPGTDPAHRDNRFRPAIDGRCLGQRARHHGPPRLHGAVRPVPAPVDRPISPPTSSP